MELKDIAPDRRRRSEKNSSVCVFYLTLWRFAMEIQNDEEKISVGQREP